MDENQNMPLIFISNTMSAMKNGVYPIPSEPMKKPDAAPTTKGLEKPIQTQPKYTAPSISNSDALALVTSKGKPRVSSHQLTKSLGNQHQAVMKLVERYKPELKNLNHLVLQIRDGERKQGGGKAERVPNHLLKLIPVDVLAEVTQCLQDTRPLYDHSDGFTLGHWNGHLGIEQK